MICFREKDVSVIAEFYQNIKKCVCLKKKKYSLTFKRNNSYLILSLEITFERIKKKENL